MDGLNVSILVVYLWLKNNWLELRIFRVEEFILIILIEEKFAILYFELLRLHCFQIYKLYGCQNN